MYRRSHVQDSGDTAIAAGSGLNVWHSLIRVTEPGENLLLLLYTEYKGAQFKIILDSKTFPLILNPFWRPTDLNENLPNSREGITLAVYDEVNDWYTILITLPLKWETSFEVTVRNPSINVIQALACVYYDRLAELPLPKPKEDVQTPGPKPDPVM